MGKKQRNRQSGGGKTATEREGKDVQKGFICQR